MSKYPTSNIALNIISERLVESFINRTEEEYAAITAKLPPIKVLHGWVNDALKAYAAAGTAPYAALSLPCSIPGHFRFQLITTRKSICRALTTAGLRSPAMALPSIGRALRMIRVVQLETETA